MSSGDRHAHRTGHRSVCVFFSGLLLVCCFVKTGAAAEGRNGHRISRILERRVDRAIEITQRRFLSIDTHTPWQIAHGVLAYRQHYLVNQDEVRVSTLDWISSGPQYLERDWFQITAHGGKAHPFFKPYTFEGHPNQFVAFFSESQLPRNFTFRAGEQTITLDDIIKNARMEVNDREEVTWTLWFLTPYLPHDAEWLNQNGEPWSITRMIDVQMKTPIKRSACGGTHGLYAIALARNKYLSSGQPLHGTWLTADLHLKRYLATAQSLQNADGSFSADFFRSQKASADISTRISTTGHMLEFVVRALPRSHLSQPWVQAAVRRVAEDLTDAKGTPLEAGGMYHAVHALVMYRELTDPEFRLGHLNLIKPGESRIRTIRAKPIPVPNQINQISGEVIMNETDDGWRPTKKAAAD